MPGENMAQLTSLQGPANGGYCHISINNEATSSCFIMATFSRNCIAQKKKIIDSLKRKSFGIFSHWKFNVIFASLEIYERPTEIQSERHATECHNIHVGSFILCVTREINSGSTSSNNLKDSYHYINSFKSFSMLSSGARPV